MERVLVGYYIGSNVQLEIAQRRLSNFDSKSRKIRCYILRETMMRLFLFLLENANGKIVTNEQIMYNVWDLHGLKSPSQRLWQVMQALKLRLATLGVEHDFIMRVETFEVKGHCLKREMIKPFYFYIEKKASDGYLP